MSIYYKHQRVVLRLGLVLWLVTVSWLPLTAVVAQDAFACADVSEIPQSECQALVAFYASTNGPDWLSQGGWLTTNTPCRWDGVGCQDGHVRTLGLTNNQLSGPIPPELGNLANLQELCLHSNNLSGTIPPELSNLTNLQSLILDINLLAGPIPSELGNLANVRRLRLANNDLSGLIPAELGNLAHLEELHLSNNDLRGPIPAELGNLAQLQVLVLEGNPLGGSIPPELGQLANLQELSLFVNQLNGPIPPELGHLANLKALFLGNNQLSGPIPPELGNLVNLQRLHLGSNALSGPIPPKLANLSGLSALLLSYNALTATDTTLLAFLAEKAREWDTTQTVPPTSIWASTLTSDRIAVSWTPISYTGDGGYYEVSYATDLAGPFTVHGVTLDKSSNQYTLTDLKPCLRYFVRVRSYTPAHGFNPNGLWSDYSSVVIVNALYLPLILQ